MWLLLLLNPWAAVSCAKNPLCNSAANWFPRSINVPICLVPFLKTQYVIVHVVNSDYYHSSKYDLCECWLYLLFISNPIIFFLIKPDSLKQKAVFSRTPVTHNIYCRLILFQTLKQGLLMTSRPRCNFPHCFYSSHVSAYRAGCCQCTLTHLLQLLQ